VRRELPAEPEQRARAEAAASEFLLGRDALNLAAFHRDCPLEARLKSGIELALWDLRGKAFGRSVAELLGGILRPRVALAACMGIRSYERAGKMARWYVEQGSRRSKPKRAATCGRISRWSAASATPSATG
jgi:L-alanine-DL-glutamate epimerase-like enolase superfamily enzyme